MVLPRGAARLRDDLGEFLKQRRQGRIGDERFGTQADVAARAGITRQTLSDIERDAAWPAPATLDALLDILELGWEHVAHSIPRTRHRPFIDDMPGGGRLADAGPDAVPATSRLFIEGVRGTQLIAFGEAVKAARSSRGLTLTEAAALAGISASTLSRIERAQALQSKAFRFEQGTDGSGPVLVVLNPWLPTFRDPSTR